MIKKTGRVLAVANPGTFTFVTSLQKTCFTKKNIEVKHHHIDQMVAEILHKTVTS